MPWRCSVCKIPGNVGVEGGVEVGGGGQRYISRTSRGRLAFVRRGSAGQRGNWLIQWQPQVMHNSVELGLEVGAANKEAGAFPMRSSLTPM